MAIRDLFFAIFAKDRTGSAFDSVNAKLREVERSATSFSDRMSRIGGQLTSFGTAATLATAPVLYAFRDVLKAYDDAERAAAKVAQAIKTTGGAAGFTAEELAKVAGALQDVTRFDGDEVLTKVTAQLLTFTNIAGDNFLRAQTAALDLATVLEGDLQGAAIMVGKALNDPVKGLAALSRAGVSFTAEQKAVIEALVETGQTAQAQAVILAELERQYGGQAIAAAQAGLGALDQLGNAWGDLKEEIGAIIAEILPPVVAFLKDLIAGFIALPEPVKKFSVILAGVGLAVGPVAVALGLLVTAIGAVGAPVAAAVAAVAGITAALVAFWPEIEATAAAISGSLSAAVGWLSDNFPTSWAEAEAAASSAIDALLPAVRAFGEAHVLAFGLVADRAAAMVEAVRRELSERLPAAFESVKAAAAELLASISAAFEAIAATVSRVVEEVARVLVEGLEAAFETVKAGVRGVEGTFAWLYDRVVGNSWVPDMVDEIGNEIARLPGEMVAPAEEAASATSGIFAGLADGAVASIRDMVRDGQFSFETFAQSMIQTADRLADDLIDGAFSRLADAGKGLLPDLLGGGSTQTTGGGPGGGGLLSGLGGALSGALGSLLDFLPGFDTGGDFAVGGRGGVDRNLVAFRASQGERVRVYRPGDDLAPRITVNITTPDPAAFRASQGQIAASLSRAVARGGRNT